MAQLAIDVETISPEIDEREVVDTLASREIELLCIGVGHRASPDSEIETRVLWRQGVDVGDEYQLLAELAERLHDRYFDEILTYNTGDFAERHLKGRSTIVGDEVGDLSLPDIVHRGWERAVHRNLMYAIVRNHGHRMEIKAAVEEHTSDHPPTVSWKGEPLTSDDIPQLGERWLRHCSGLMDLGDPAPRLKDAIQRHVEADLELHFRLADSLDGRTTT